MERNRNQTAKALWIGVIGLLLLTGCQPTRSRFPAKVVLGELSAPKVYATAPKDTPAATNTEAITDRELPARPSGQRAVFMKSMHQFQRRIQYPPAVHRRTWPRKVQWQWADFLGHCEAYLRQGRFRMADLHRLRITLEAEAQKDANRYGKLPKAMHRRIGIVLKSTDYVIAQLNAKALARAPKQKANKPARKSSSAKRLYLRWPLGNPIITSFYGMRQDPLTPSRRRFHAGIDLSARAGSLVRSAAAGIVTRAGWAGNHGKTVIVRHAGGYRTVYSHLETILTAVGSTVASQAVIGLVGSTGRSTGPHLHFEIHYFKHTVDPLDYLEVPLDIEQYVPTFKVHEPEPPPSGQPIS